MSGAWAGPAYKRRLVRAFLYCVLCLLESVVLPVAVLDESLRQPLKERRGPGAGEDDELRATWLDTCPELARALELLGVPCLLAAGEVDPALALLSRSGEVDGVASDDVASDDVDSLAFGARAVLRGVSFKDGV